jgi:uncharacterized protein (TIRG00374 family)
VADATPPGDGSGAARRRLSPRTRLALAALAWLVATALVLGALRAVGGPAALAAVRRARPEWLLAAVLCHASILPLWAWQTVVLLPRPAGAPAPVGFGRVFEVQALSATAANTVPAFLGQATGVALLAERAGVGSAAALSVFAQHNLVEGLAKLAMVGVAAQVVPLPPRMRGAVAALTAGTGLLVALVGGAAWAVQRRPAAVAAAHAGDLRGAGAAARLRALVLRWAASLDALRDPRRLATALVAALLMRVVEGAGWWAVERAFDVAPRPGSPALALAATNLASALPASPGNLGVYEGAAYTAYHVLLGVPRDTAVALALVGHAVYLAPLVGVGWALLSARQLAGARARRRAARSPQPVA